MNKPVNSCGSHVQGQAVDMKQYNMVSTDYIVDGRLHHSTAITVMAMVQLNGVNCNEFLLLSCQ